MSEILDSLSIYFTDRLIGCSARDSDRYAILEYGFKQIIANVLWIVSTTILGLIFFNWQFLVAFILYFVPLRLFAGGYHCNTYAACFIVTNLIFIAVCVCSRLVILSGLAYLDVFILIGSVLYIFAYAPAPNPKHPISKKKLKRNRLITREILITLLVLVMLEGIVIKSDVILTVASFSVFAVAILMGIEQIKKRREISNHD